jgi:hypothetical protein
MEEVSLIVLILVDRLFGWVVVRDLYISSWRPGSGRKREHLDVQ